MIGSYMTRRVYNHRRDDIDVRDYRIQFHETLLRVPPLIDLRKDFSPISDQGQLGSCTAHAVCAVFEYMIKTRYGNNFYFNTSRLAEYYWTRICDNPSNASRDTGGTIRCAVKVMNQIGVCTERCWPYMIQRFTMRPPNNCWTEASKNRVVQYARVSQTLEQIRYALIRKCPVIIGFLVYESFELDVVSRTGYVPMPNRKTERVLGGHAVAIVGMTDKYFIFRNSWGNNWGEGGYGYFPHELVLDPNITMDMWVITDITTNSKKSAYPIYKFATVHKIDS